LKTEFHNLREAERQRKIWRKKTVFFATMFERVRMRWRQVEKLKKNVFVLL